MHSGQPLYRAITYPLLVGSGASHRCLVNDDTAGCWTEGWAEGWAGAQSVGMVALSSNFLHHCKRELGWSKCLCPLHLVSWLPYF